MEKRRFGRTGHMSTVAIFGTAALGESTQEIADKAMEEILKHSVNHIDVAPSYGDAELRLAPWMPAYRDDFFLGCKTMERAKEDAWAEANRSLERLDTDHFDLYQLHAISSMDKLDLATKKGGALEAATRARDEGITHFIGITGHGHDVPDVLLEALRRFDFDSVLFPLNPTLLGIPSYSQSALALLAECRQKDIGVMIIKSIAKGLWGEKEHTYDCWYEPFTQPEDIQRLVTFALSYDVTGICTAGDTTLLPLVLEACEAIRPFSEEEKKDVIQDGRQYEPVFQPPWLA